MRGSYYHFLLFQKYLRPAAVGNDDSDNWPTYEWNSACVAFSFSPNQCIILRHTQAHTCLMFAGQPSDCAALSIRNICGKQAAMPRIIFSTFALIEQEQ